MTKVTIPAESLDHLEVVNGRGSVEARRQSHTAHDTVRPTNEDGGMNVTIGGSGFENTENAIEG